VIHESIDVVPATARILAMAIAAGAVGATASFVYRWYSGQSIPEGVAILLGVSVVATALNTTATLKETVAADELVGTGAAGFTIAAFVVGTIAADAGRRFGEGFAGSLPSVDSVRTMESDVGALVRAAGRVIRVHVPETIEDIDGYEPVPEEVKADLAGTTFLFPRRMTVAELRGRLVDRLKRDYEVGHVDVELADDGTVEYLALGRRLAGVGQTLAPGTVAVAIRADPALTATPGDRVQIWRVPSSTDGADATAATDAAAPANAGSADAGTHDAGAPDPGETAPGAPSAGTDGTDRDARTDGPKLITTGELRAAAGDVATIAVDESDADRLADDVRYRLVTLPAAVQPEREFASLLRNADETMGSIVVEPGSEMDGRAVEDVDLTVVAVRAADSSDGGREREGTVTAIPAGDRVLRAGETVYVMGRPEAIRRLEASGAAPADGPTSSGSADDDHVEAPPTDADD
jgi:hypothetical protein